MIVIGADGMKGTMSTPLSISERFFSQAEILQRGLTGLLSQSITVVENGDIRISAEAIANPRNNDVVGDYTARTCYIYKDTREINTKIKAVLERCNELYFEKFENGNGIDVDGEYAKTIDVMLQTVPRVKKDKFLLYYDRHDLVIESEVAFKAKQDDKLQEFITNTMLGMKTVPVLKQIGFGLLREEWSKMTRPCTYIRIGSGTVIKADKTRNTFIKSEWQAQAFYMYLLAAALEKFLGEAVPAYEQKDWVAFANILVSWISGFGDTNRDQIWDADDIEVQMNTVPGYGWTLANRFLFGHVKVAADFKMYWVTMTILGLVAARTKAASTEMKLRKKLATNDFMVATLMKDAFGTNIDGWGSQGTYYMLMPRNNFAFGDKTDVPVPCIVDDDDDMVLDETDRRELLKKANNYEKILPYEQQSWKDVTVDKGEVPQGAVDSSSTQAQFIRLHATTDARIVEFDDMSSRFSRKIIQWRFPMQNIVLSDEIDRTQRLRLFFWGMMANGEKGQKNAYVIESSLDVFDAQVVNYRRGPRDTMLVDKEDSNTVGDQVVKPGTIPTIPVSRSETEVATTVQPPAPEKRAREPEVVVDTKSGKTEVENREEHVESESNSETSNVVTEE
jgi:hypothetical protein